MSQPMRDAPRPDALPLPSGRRRRLTRALCGALVGASLLAGCTAPPPRAAVTSRAPAVLDQALPQMKRFSGAGSHDKPLRPNAQMARDFMDLSFELESGRALPVFTRFEGPVTVRVDGGAPRTLTADLDALLGRLRSEAGIDIHRVPGASPANITIATVPRAEMQKLVPQAACFVSPRISTWAEFKGSRRGGTADWTTLKTRRKMAIFIPADVAPQEIRDCLHEELAQSLGPLNDLYRLPDSVFNDDNFHTILTGFDMLMLRVTYAPELHSGMTPAEVAQRVPGLLARLNPGGGTGAMAPRDETPRSWIHAVEEALGVRTNPGRRQAAAQAAVDISDRERWAESRRAFSLYILGRLSIATEPDLALASFLNADAIYRSRPVTRVQAAHVAMQLAAYALSSGNADAVQRIVDANKGAAVADENAALLAQLLLMKAEALSYIGRRDEAAQIRHEALGWARYGFGSDTEVLARAAEIAALAPRQGPTTTPTRIASK